MQYRSFFKIVKNTNIAFMRVYIVLTTQIRCVVCVILPERYNANERLIKDGGRELTRKAQFSSANILFTESAGLVGLVPLLLKNTAAAATIGLVRITIIIKNCLFSRQRHTPSPLPPTLSVIPGHIQTHSLTHARTHAPAELVSHHIF